MTVPLLNGVQLPAARGVRLSRHGSRTASQARASVGTAAGVGGVQAVMHHFRGYGRQDVLEQLPVRLAGGRVVDADGPLAERQRVQVAGVLHRGIQLEFQSVVTRRQRSPHLFGKVLRRQVWRQAALAARAWAGVAS